MPRKKTEVRVKRTEAVAALARNGEIERQIGGKYMDRRLWIWDSVIDTLNTPVTIIDRRDLADLEARLTAAEAECKRLRKKTK